MAHIHNVAVFVVVFVFVVVEDAADDDDDYEMKVLLYSLELSLGDLDV